MEERTVDIVLIGVGNLGRRFLQLVSERDSRLEKLYGLRLRVVGVADSRGAAWSPDGLNLETVVGLKEGGGSVADYRDVGYTGVEPLEVVSSLEADVLCEASPVNLADGGEPGLSCIRAALERGMHVVTPNKGPMVLAYRELVETASAQGVKLRFDGTVAGGLPALYLGMRDLRGSVIERIETVPNVVTGYILDLLGGGMSWDDALAKAKQIGHLEADPAWDVDGWDATAKLAILANAVLGLPVSLDDVDRKGIRGIRPEEIHRERESGRSIRLLGRAERGADGDYSLSVQPEALPSKHPLGRLGSHELGIVYYTDIYGTISAVIDEPTPLPSAATMLRDILDIYVADRYCRPGINYT